MTVTKSSYELRPNDLYETEPWAVEALLREVTLSTDIHEPSAGNHKIADCLKEHGYRVTTNDIAVYNRAHDTVGDFLNDCEPKRNVITNPPYGRGNRLAVKFVERSLSLATGHVAMLLTAKFDFGKTRTHLFRDNSRFMLKINLLDRISWEGNGQTGTEDHAWYVWGPEFKSYFPTIKYQGKEKAE